MKKTICLVLVLILGCLSLVACGNTDNSNNVELDEEAIGVIAFSKWLEENMQANLLYNNNDCVWTASITPEEDGTIIVDLALYDREAYTALENAGQGTSMAMMLSGRVELSPDDIN